jgi:SAM-dependent methyltransferase
VRFLGGDSTELPDFARKADDPGNQDGGLMPRAAGAGKVAYAIFEGHETADDFSLFLHDLRTRELKRLTPGASVVLSGGAAGNWYFDWFESHYPSPVSRHIAVEAFEPKPDDLPSHVDWIAASLGDLGPVDSRSVDLAFGGQVIEHLWPDEIVGFLCASHRVLRPGGRLVLDSPNRRVTESIQWLHPEHTVEFAVDEIAELLELAGYEDVDLRGVLLAYDADRHRFLSLAEMAATSGRERRSEEAADRPEDSFVWWAEAVRKRRSPDVQLLTARVLELFSRFRRRRLVDGTVPAADVYNVAHLGRIVRAARGTAGPLFFGPHIPIPRGDWEAVIELSSPDASERADDAVVASLDVVHGDPPSRVAGADVTAGALEDSSRWTRHSLEFSLREQVVGAQFRVMSSGAATMLARAGMEFRPREWPEVAPPRFRRATLGAWLRRRGR